MPLKPTNQLLAAALLGLSSISPSASAAPTMAQFGIPDYEYPGIAISRDGSTIAGYINFTSEGQTFGPAVTHVYTWNLTKGFRVKVNLAVTQTLQTNETGDIVVGGFLGNFGFGFPSGAFRWNAPAGTLTQPPFPDSSRALAVTPDGAIMIYSGYGLRIWDGTTDLVLSTTAHYYSGCVSDDSGVVAAFDPYGQTIHRWNRARERAQMVFPAGVSPADYHIAMSADGSRLYACGRRPDESVLVRWNFDDSDNAVSEVVCTLPQWGQMEIAGTTTDGTTVAFFFNGVSYLWIDSIGLIPLDDHLRSNGVQLPLTDNRQIRGISGDGLAFVGTESLAGGPHIWYVNLGPSARPYCASDFNFDSVVDDADFVYFAGIYDASFCQWHPFHLPQPCPDLNQDSYVDDADFILFVTEYEALACP